MSNPTSLGRILPIFKGEYSNSTKYNKLDIVLYNGNSFVSKRDNNKGNTPSTETDYWQLVATGINAVKGYIEISETGTKADVDVSIDETTRELVFDFTIPATKGTGVLEVDGSGPNGSGQVQINAVKYVQQNLSPTQQGIVLNNIGAIPKPTNPANNNVLKYNGTTWVAGTVNEVPTSGTAGTFLKKTNSGSTWVTVNQVPASGETGTFLKKTDSGSAWVAVNEIPTGGSTAGLPLVKRSGSNYDVTWGSFITDAEIDTIMGISNS